MRIEEASRFHRFRPQKAQAAVQGLDEDATKAEIDELAFILTEHSVQPSEAVTAQGLPRPRLAPGTRDPFTTAVKRLHGRGLCLPLCMLGGVERPDVNAALSACLGAEAMARTLVCSNRATEAAAAASEADWRALLCAEASAAAAAAGFAAPLPPEDASHPQRPLELPEELKARLLLVGIDLEAPGSGFVGAAVNLLHVPPQLLAGALWVRGSVW